MGNRHNGHMAEPGANFADSVLGRLRPSEPAEAAVGPVTIGRGDRRPFAGDSPLQPLDRLARYVPDGVSDESGTWTSSVRDLLGMETRAAGDQPDLAPPQRFAPVHRGDLTDVERVYVFVHGWVPGSRSVAEEMFIEQGETALAWDDRVANVAGLSLVELYEPLLAALTKRDPEAAVLWYSWVDQSGTDTELFAARSSLSNTGINGRRLAAALTWAIGQGSPGVHLIGHSHGSVVATYAALALGQPVAHLTLLDCPEDWFSRAGGAAGLLPTILPRLRPGRGPRVTFVDAYASMFGRSYHDDPGLAEVVDVRLAPLVRRSDPAAPVSQAHQFPVSWYANTVTDEEAVGGFAWSPLHGFDTAQLGTAYLSSSKGRMTELIRRRSQPRVVEGPEQVLTVIESPPQELSRRSPDVAYVLVLPDDAQAVEFDLSFDRPAADTRVDVAVNGQLTCTGYASAPLPVRGRFVRVAPGRTNVHFRLVDPGLLTSATVSRVRVRRGHGLRRINLDDTGAAARIAAAGAVAGALAMAGVFAVGLGIRAGMRRARSAVPE